MNFQHNLFKRKGRFGTIWLAAHHPAKLSKIEVIHLNLTKKCQEIIEFVLNGREDRPKFSLLISSHLMYGLCVLVKKQNQYIYDDLVYLRQEIHKCYINEKLVFKKPKETPRKTPKKVSKQVDRTIITLKENLPDLMTSFETFYELETERLERNLERIELEKTPAPRISIVEEEFLEPVTVIQSEDFQFDTGMAFLHDNLQDTFFNVQNLERTKMTSTVKQLDRLQPRIPFKELSTNEQIRRAELTEGRFQETTIYDELESLLARKHDENVPPMESFIPPPHLGIPELYQETFFEPPVAAPLPEATEVTFPEAPTEAVQETVPPEVAPVPETTVLEVTIPKKVRREKKRGLIIDEVTQIPKQEMSKRLKRIEDKDKESIDIDEQFQRYTAETNLRIDYISQDLLKHPSSLLMRQPRLIPNRDLLRNIKCRLMQTSLKTTRVETDEFYYTTESRQRVEETQSLLEQRRDVVETTERGQKRQSTTRLEHESLEHAKLSKTKEGEFESRVHLEESNTIQEQFQEQFEVPPVLAPPMYEETPAIVVQPPSPEKVPEMESYEKILVDEIQIREERYETPVLQNIIREADLGVYGGITRRKFAVKLFQQSLVMCSKQKLECEQTEMYKDIVLRLI